MKISSRNARPLPVSVNVPLRSCSLINPNAIRFSRSTFVEILFRSWGLMFWHQQSKRSTSTSRTLKSTPAAPPPLFLRTPKLSLRHIRHKNNFGVLCPPLCGGNLLPPHSRQIGVYFLLPAPDKIASSLNAFRSFIPQQVSGCGTSHRKYRIRAGICWVSTPIRAFAFSTIVRNRSLGWHNHWSVPQRSREHPPKEAA